jgi:hypothetical protein
MRVGYIYAEILGRASSLGRRALVPEAALEADVPRAVAILDDPHRHAAGGADRRAVVVLVARSPRHRA